MKNRATDKDQKKQVINDLLNLWLTYPDLRLGQLICGAISSEQDAFLFYCEDKILIKRMRDNMKQITKKEEK